MGASEELLVDPTDGLLDLRRRTILMLLAPNFIEQFLVVNQESPSRPGHYWIDVLDPVFREEISSESFGVGQALQDCVHETGVSQVLQSTHAIADVPLLSGGRLNQLLFLYRIKLSKLTLRHVLDGLKFVFMFESKEFPETHLYYS